MENISKTLSLVSQFLLTSIIFLLPIFFIPTSWVTIPHAKMFVFSIFTLLALLFWIIAKLYKGSVSIPLSLIAGVSLLLPVVYLFSAIFSGSTGGSFIGLGFERDTVIAMVLWVFAMFAVVLTFDTTSSILKSYRILILSGAVIAIFEILNHVVGNRVVSLNGLLTLPPATIIGSWHDLSIFLGLIVFTSSTFLGSKFGNKNTKIISIVAISFSLILLSLINSIDVWIALAVLSGTGLAYPYFFKIFDKKKSEANQIPDVLNTNELTKKEGGINIANSIPFIISLVLSILFIFFGSIFVDKIPESFRVVEFEVRPSWEGTFAVASSVYQERGFLFGSGPNTFNRQWGLYKPAGVNETAFWNTDFSQGIGFIPTSIINSGIIGAIVWLLFFLVLIYRGIKTLISPPNDGDGRWRGIYLGLFGGVIYLWVFHLVYPPGVALLALTFLITGVFIASQRVSGVISSRTIIFKESKKIGIATMAALIIVAIISILLLFLSIRALTADMLVNRSVSIFNKTGNIEEAQRVLGKSLAMDSKSTRARRAAVELGMLEFQKYVQAGDINEEQQNQLKNVLEQTIGHALSAINTNEADYQNWLILARLYEQLAGVQIEGAYVNAKAAYERAAAENPTNPEPNARLAQLAISQGDIDSARENLEKAISRKKNYPIAHYLLSQIEASLGNIEGAIISAENAAISAPQEPLAWFQLGVLNHSIGNYEKAASALEQAIILNQNYANALYVLGLDYYELGRVDDSLKMFLKVLELNPDNELVKTIIKNLTEGVAPLAGGSLAE
jgi:tetratricopeptide (TPR) repeat protein